MKNKIRHAFEQDTPDIWAGICYDCALQTAPQSASASKIVHYREPKPNFLADALQIAAIAAVFVLIVGGSIGLFGLRQNHHGGPSLGTNPPTPGITTQPTTQPTHPTETDPTQPPTTEPPPPPSTDPTQPSEPELPHSYGTAFVYPNSNITLDTSSCSEGHLYYADFETSEVFYVCEGPIRDCSSNDFMIFYVKESEPTKIYARALWDLSQQLLIYESDSGEINEINECSYQHHNTTIEMVVGNQKLIWLDIATGKTQIMFEAYQIEHGTVMSDECSTPEGFFNLKSCLVKFYGQFTAADKSDWCYYRLDTGEIIPDLLDDPRETVCISTDLHSYGAPFIHDSSLIGSSFHPGITEGTDGHLYYYDFVTDQYVLVRDEQILLANANDYMIFFVRASEPNRVYATLIGDFSREMLIYESEYAAINSIVLGWDSCHNTSVQILEGNKRLLWCDIITGNSWEIFEAYYLKDADISFKSCVFYGERYVVDIERIVFYGQINDNGEMGAYFYFPVTDTYKINNIH